MFRYYDDCWIKSIKVIWIVLSLKLATIVVLLLDIVHTYLWMSSSLKPMHNCFGIIQFLCTFTVCTFRSYLNSCEHWTHINWYKLLLLYSYSNSFLITRSHLFSHIFTTPVLDSTVIFPSGIETLVSKCPQPFSTHLC